MVKREQIIVSKGYFIQDIKPIANYIPAMKVNEYIYTSGHLPFKDSVLQFPGIVGNNVSVEQAGEAIILSIVNALSSIKKLIDDIDNIKNIVRLVGYISSHNKFHDQHLVLDYGSNFLKDVFREEGVHIRSAVGVKSLPLNSSVEIEIMVHV